MQENTNIFNTFNKNIKRVSVYQNIFYFLLRFDNSTIRQNLFSKWYFYMNKFSLYYIYYNIYNININITYYDF
jgi:hypothetical protein